MGVRCVKGGLRSPDAGPLGGAEKILTSQLRPTTTLDQHSLGATLDQQHRRLLNLGLGLYIPACEQRRLMKIGRQQRGQREQTSLVRFHRIRRKQPRPCTRHHHRIHHDRSREGMQRISDQLNKT